NSVLGWLARGLLFLSGLVMALPGDTVVIALSNWEIIGVAVVLAVLGIVASRFSRLDPLAVPKVSETGSSVK
ncbi:MAG: hypothetical protein P1V34_01575, partial [Alphaproteobacteria bacterium]|nr:hypothetical protein [Alphaproteobacteria bacterium]